MKLFFYILIIIILFTNNVFADKFIVESFKEDSKDLAARRFERKNINEEVCALIKIRSDITSIKFDANAGIAGNIDYKEGEYWLYVTPGEKRITMFKDGFVKRDYNIPIKIESGIVYVMVLTKEISNLNPNENTTGFVFITSNPDKSDIRINDEYKGQTPFQAELNEGTYNYKISKELYYNEEKQFEIKRNETSKFNVTLKPNFGSLKITSNPANAEIIIDNKSYQSKTPCVIDKLSKGKHSITLKKDKYEQVSKEFYVEDEKQTELEISLISTVATLTINSTPENGAIIILDNNQLNEKTPVTIKELPVGEHSVTIKKELFEPETQSFSIISGETKELNLTMKPIFGVVNISASPTADIFIDGTKVGNDLYSGRLIKGVHTIEIKKDKYYAETKKVNIETGKKENFTFDLKPITGILSVMSKPAEADIIINGKKYGTTPQIIKDLIIGEYDIKLEKQGCAPVLKKINIKENEKTTINETLATGQKVNITCSDEGAELFIDGKSYGLLPQAVTLPFGEQTFLAKKTGCTENLQKIIISSTTDNVSLSANCVEYFTDSRDGKKYKTVKIGKQIWMAENLNYNASNSWCYDNNTSNCDTYGRLYDWQTAKTACPKGWHLPSDAEWKQIEMFLGLSIDDANQNGQRGENENIGGKLKAINIWKDPNIVATNNFGFSAIPSGTRYAGGLYCFIRLCSEWWSCSEYNATNAWRRCLLSNYSGIKRDYHTKTYGLSLRCVKDK